MTGGTQAGKDGLCCWHEEPFGRCGDPVTFPGNDTAPPFCIVHLQRLEPWIRSRAAAPASNGDDWIRWAARRAAAAEDGLRTLGAIRGDSPRTRTLSGIRRVVPTAPEHR